MSSTSPVAILATMTAAPITSVGRFSPRGLWGWGGPFLLPLDAREARDATLGHGLDALLEVLGLAQASLLTQLVLRRFADALGEIGAHGRSGCDHAEPRVLGDLGCELLRARTALIAA